MQRFFQLSMISLVLITGIFTQNIELMAQDVPLIDRNIFFDNPEISGGQISPDGKWFTFIKPFNEVRNIWIKGVDDKFESARPITADTTRPIPGYFWSHDSKQILYVQDKGGNENYHVYSLDPFSKVKGIGGVPPARNITEFEGVRAMIQHLPKTNPGVIYVGMNDRDASWHDLYKVTISTGARELIYENTDRISGFDFDHNDKIRLAARVKNDGSTELLKFENGKFLPFYECSFEESCYVAAYHKDNQRVYLVTNKGQKRDKTELVLYNPDTGSEEFVERDPMGKADFGGAFFSEITHNLIATSYTGDKRVLYFKDEAYEKDYAWLKKQLPGVEVGMGRSTNDEKIFLVYANSDTDPGAVYLFDRKSRDLKFQYRPRPELPTEHLSKMTPVSYPSYDGLEIPAYLTTPKGEVTGGKPAVLLVHGGPWARDYWGYNSYAQFLANRGYVVLQPNFRSSTGFGKKFLNAGNGEWGEKMQDDITSGVDYLVKKGLADKDKIAIVGGSYGGYATLAGVTFTPDVYAAAVSIVGPSSLITLLESIPPYWEAGRVIMYKRMANPETEEGLAKLKKQSPLYSVDKIKTPLMVVQGANDPRVKQAESDQIVIAMREAGMPVQYLVAEDEGHGFRKPVNQLAFIAQMEKFLSEHLGGRYQKGMKDDVAKRLGEITMDISEVKMPEMVSDKEMNMPLPELVHPAKDYNLNYSMKIEMGAQAMSLQVTKNCVKSADGIQINTSIESPMMNMTESLTLNNDCTPKAKSIAQGPMKMTYAYSDKEVKSTVDMNGDVKEMSADLDNAIWDSNTGLEMALCMVDLEKLDGTMVRVFDNQANKVEFIRIKIGEMVDVETPAGTFEARKVELFKGDEKTPSTNYFAEKNGLRVLVRQESVIKEMGGAKATLELTKIN